MKNVPQKRWIGFSRKTVFIAIGVIVSLILVWAVLAITSTIPYLWSWSSRGGMVKETQAFWDGRWEVKHFPRTAWILVAECAIWSVLAGAVLTAGFLALRWLKGPNRPKTSLGRVVAWAIVAATLFASAAGLAMILDP